MKKKAYPLGEYYDQMSNMWDIKNKPEDREINPVEPHDTFVDVKFTNESTAVPTMTVGEGMIAPMEVTDKPYTLRNNADDTLLDVEDDDVVIATFACDVAKTTTDKIAGLQSYNSLPKNAGLLFEYSRPTDVTYHMGSVSFPIDIIFLDGKNKIKKIHKNIEPGTLGIYSCASTLNVLEICGGLSDRLGIKVGNTITRRNGKKEFEKLNKIASNFGSSRSVVAVTYSNMQSSRCFNWRGYPIFNFGMSKFASTENIEFKSPTYVPVFHFDSVIASKIKVSKASDSGKLHRTISGRVIYAEKEEELDTEEIVLDLEKDIVKSLDKLDECMPMEISETEIFIMLDDECDECSSDIVIATKYDTDLVRKLVCAKAEYVLGKTINTSNLSVIKVSYDFDTEDIISNIRTAYNKDVLFYSTDNKIKLAGSAVPDETKSIAKKAYKHLEKAESLANKSLDNLRKNVQEYNKIQDDIESIPSTKGQFNQSAKRNTKLVRDYLVEIRDSIKLLNSIKDISTTMDVIDSLANTSKEASEIVEEVFALISQIEAPDFVLLLGSKTELYATSISNLTNAIERGMAYINTDILGLIILSD